MFVRETDDRNFVSPRTPAGTASFAWESARRNTIDMKFER
jgi:hypothetical protein